MNASTMFSCMSQTTLAARARFGIAVSPKLQPQLPGSDELRGLERRLARFLFGRPFGRWEGLETLVRNRLAALDRKAVRTGG
jgi:hypothetical protein